MGGQHAFGGMDGSTLRWTAATSSVCVSGLSRCKAGSDVMPSGVETLYCARRVQKQHYYY